VTHPGATFGDIKQVMKSRLAKGNAIDVGMNRHNLPQFATDGLTELVNTFR